MRPKVVGIVFFIGLMLIGCASGLTEAEIDSMVQQGISEYEESHNDQIVKALDAQLNERITLLRDELAKSDSEDSLNVGTLIADKVIVSSLQIQNDNDERVALFRGFDFGSSIQFFEPAGNISGIILNGPSGVTLSFGDFFLSGSTMRFSDGESNLTLSPTFIDIWENSSERASLTSSRLSITSNADGYIVLLGSDESGGADLKIVTEGKFVSLP